jgi:Flp pilus assembly pilin Flp
MILASRFVKEQDATTVTEYAVMLGLIVMAAVMAISTLGRSVAGAFSRAAGLLPGG